LRIFDYGTEKEAPANVHFGFKRNTKQIMGLEIEAEDELIPYETFDYEKYTNKIQSQNQENVKKLEKNRRKNIKKIYQRSAHKIQNGTQVSPKKI